jgi:hypothetical protein
VYSALFTGIPLDRHAFVNNFQLLFIGCNYNFVDRNDGNDSEDCTRGLPAFRAATSVVMEYITTESHFNFIVGAMAVEFTAGETGTAFRDAVVEKGMK